VCNCSGRDSDGAVGSFFSMQVIQCYLFRDIVNIRVLKYVRQRDAVVVEQGSQTSLYNINVDISIKAYPLCILAPINVWYYLVVASAAIRRNSNRQNGEAPTHLLECQVAVKTEQKVVVANENGNGMIGNFAWVFGGPEKLQSQNISVVQQHGAFATRFI
jgi:hypothetical protein